MWYNKYEIIKIIQQKNLSFAHMHLQLNTYLSYSTFPQYGNS